MGTTMHLAMQFQSRRTYVLTADFVNPGFFCRALCQRIFGLIPEDTPEHLKERSVANQTKYAEKATAAV